MVKGLIYLALFLVLLVSCEEYYKPNLDVAPGMLVVESCLTNDSSRNFVKLSMTKGFYSNSPDEKIIGATAELIEVGGQTINGIENNSGYFTFLETPVSGKQYKLRISYQNDIFESEFAIMPPLPSIDSLYTKHKVETSYQTDASGKPLIIKTPGREICIDAPITPELKYYRFNSREVLQWAYFPPSMGPAYFGWVPISDNGIFNLAGLKEFSTSSAVKVHPIFSLAYDAHQYLDSAAQIPEGWIAIIDQYGITKESYDFHEKLNQQFSAEGSLFDPVLTQVTGNIHCKNDPSKIVLGFFDLNSYRQYRYFLDIGSDENSTGFQRRINRYFDIPEKGYQIRTYPVFWEFK